VKYLTSGDFDFWPFKIKISKPLNPVLWNIHTNFELLGPICFCLEARTGRTDRQTERWAGKTRNAAYRTTAT